MSDRLTCFFAGPWTADLFGDIESQILVGQRWTFNQLKSLIVSHLLILIRVHRKGEVSLTGFQQLEPGARIGHISENDSIERSRIPPVVRVTLDDDLVCD